MGSSDNPLHLSLSLYEQNDIYEWARDHRVHHKYSETDADPHNATRGFFFAHIGWLMVRKHPDVIEKGKKLELSDLKADKVVMFQRRWANYPSLFWGFLLLFLSTEQILFSHNESPDMISGCHWGLFTETCWTRRSYKHLTHLWSVLLAKPNKVERFMADSPEGKLVLCVHWYWMLSMSILLIQNSCI